MTRQRAVLVVFSLAALLLGTPLLAAGPPPPGHWVVDYAEYDYGWSDSYSHDHIVFVWEDELGTYAPYLVGYEESLAAQGWVTTTAWCYSKDDLGGNPIHYQFTVGGTSALFVKLNLRATGPRPGPPPSTWKQQGYNTSEPPHRLTQTPGPLGDPGPTWAITWYSEAMAGGHKDSMSHFKNWSSDNWSHEWTVLEAEGSWVYVDTDWHGVGCIRAMVTVDCALSEGSGSLKAEVDHWVNDGDWGSRHDP